MGWNTVAVLLNDATGQIEGDAEFGRRLAYGMRRMSNGERINVDARTSRSVHANAATIISHGHADSYQIVVVCGNTGYRVTHDPDDGTPPEIIACIEHVLKMRKRAIKGK